jgi:hypothetical protein
MHLHEESYVHSSLIGQTCVAAGQNNVGVYCTNPRCSRELVYLREGTLKLLEMESDSDARPRRDNGPFQMRFLPKKYFWLCSECAKRYVVKQWTNSGIVLEIRKRQNAGTQPILVALQSYDSQTQPQDIPEDVMLSDIRSIA